MKFYLLIIAVLFIFAGCSLLDKENNKSTGQITDRVACPEDAKICPDGEVVMRIPPSCEFQACPDQASTQELVLEEPIKEFKSRISKKPFGIYITPENSPVKPERFQGYHTGLDVEYTDSIEEVPVYAIADGIIELADYVSGYGGVLAIRHIIDGNNYLVIYGHLNPSSLPTVHTTVKAGEQIGLLGRGGTNETDGERKHLHLAVYPGDDLNLRGYVQTKGELENWIDPLTLY